jgi:DNA processing protein
VAREHLESYLDAAALALLLEKRSRSAVRRQIGTQGSAFAALVASLGTGITTVAARRRAERRADDYLQDCRRQGIDLASIHSGHFPALLGCIPDAPLMLYSRGDTDALEQPAVAIVGARRASRYGLEIARNIAAVLAKKGMLVVSGLALGIDGAAHEGALSAGGRTLAVLGSGLNRVQPISHSGLARRILESNGMLLSEYSTEQRAFPHHFPERNRLISGLSCAVVVIEASARSGSLITARLALEQGREVMAVPGVPGLPNSAGANRLLKQGAALIETAEDVLHGLGIEERSQPMSTQAVSPGIQPGLTAATVAVLDELGFEASSVDLIAARLKLSTQECNVRLTELELGGFVQRVADGYIRRPISS